MVNEPLSMLLNDVSTLERARWFEILNASNASETLDELTRYCLDTLREMLPFHFAFFLLCDGERARLVLEQSRRVPPNLERALSALEMPREFFDTLSQPGALESLRVRVNEILRAHQVNGTLLIALTAGATTVGLLALAPDSHPEAQSFPLSQMASPEFLDAVGAVVGTGAKRLLKTELLHAREKAERVNQGALGEFTEAARTLAELTQRNHELERLQVISDHLNHGLIAPETANRVLDIVRELIHADAIAVQVIHATQSYATLVGARGFEADVTKWFACAPFQHELYQADGATVTASNLIEYMAQSKRILTTTDFAKVPDWNVTLFDALGYTALLAFPIQFDLRVHGLALCAWKNARGFDPHTLQLVENIAGQLGMALRQYRLLDDLRNRADLMQIVAQTSNWLQFAPRAEQALPRVIREIGAALKASYVVVQLWRGDHFEMVTASDARESHQCFGIAPYEKRLLASELPLVVNDVNAADVDAEQRAILLGLNMRASYAVRLYAHERALGLLFVNQDTPREWDTNDAQWIQAFAQQIAYALENKRLLDEVNQQVQESKTLGRVSRLIAAAMPPDRALYAVADQVARLFKADYVGFHLRKQDTLHLVAESRDLASTPVLPILPHHLQILEELIPIRVTNAEVDAANPAQREFLRKHGIVADLGVPLRAGNKALGILYISHHEPREWTDAQIQLAESFGQQIASALKTAQLHSELKIQVRDLRTLANDANMLARSRVPEVALPYAALDLRQLLGADYVGFHLVEGNELRVITENHHNLNEVRYPIKPYHQPILRDFQRIVITDRDVDAKNEMHRAMLAEYSLRADVAVPMVARGSAIGILFVSQATARQWQENEINLIETYAHYLAHVLENAQLLNEKEKRVLELSQLLEFSELTASIANQETLIEMALPLLNTLVGSDRVLALTFQDGQFHSLRSSDGQLFSAQPPPLTRGLRELIENRQPVLFDAAHPFPLDGAYATRMDFHAAKAFILIPLVMANETIGSLSFLFQTPQRFSDNAVRLAQSAGNQLAMALANSRLVQEQRTRLDKQSALSEFSLWCGTVRDSNTLEIEATQRVRVLLQVQATSIRQLHGTALTIGASDGYTNPEARAHPIVVNAPLERVLRHHKPYAISNLAQEKGVPAHWRERQMQEGFCSLLMLPMLAEHQVLGILTLFRDHVHTWQLNEIQFAQAVANTLALALSHVQQIEQVEHTSQELRATLDSVFSGVLTTDADGIIQSWNRAASDITDFTPDEMIGKRWDLEGPRVGTHKRDDNLIWEVMTEQRKQFSHAARTFRCADGREIQLREAAAPLLDLQGNVRGAVLAFWDWTMELETTRARLNQMSLLGHQLENKIGALLWGAEGLNNPTLKPSSRAEYMRLITDTRRELEQFSQELAALEREHVHNTIQDAPIELKKLVGTKIANWKLTHPEHHFRTRGAFDVVRGDEMRLAVVIDNLLDNACKYSPKGSTITVHAACPNSQQLRLTFHNQNVGNPLSRELQARLFERGARGDSDQPGSGLGLWLVRTKLDEIGGEVRVTSSARRGTSFIVTLNRPTR